MPHLAEAEEFTGMSEKAKKRAARKAEKARRQAKRNPKPLKPRNSTQQAYINSILKNDLTFGIGPAGVGKTYVPARIFGEQLKSGAIYKLYIARPNVSKAKHRNGFLPGTIEDKTAPWMVPIFTGLQDSMSKADFARMRQENRIEEVPYEFIQGRTFDNSACIVDEAENLDFDDLYITLTRPGDNSRMVLCGDPNQARIHDSAFFAVAQMAQAPWMVSVDVITFTEDDVVRSIQAKQWVKAFNRANQQNLRDEHDCGITSAGFREKTPKFIT